jgi:hypothetical protein
MSSVGCFQSRLRKNRYEWSLVRKDFSEKMTRFETFERDLLSAQYGQIDFFLIKIGFSQRLLPEAHRRQH